MTRWISPTPTSALRSLGKAGAPITTHLPQLIAPNASITDLTGLEGATNLMLLELGINQPDGWILTTTISDLSPLKGLTNLKYLILITTQYPTSHL